MGDTVCIGMMDTRLISILMKERICDQGMCLVVFGTSESAPGSLICVLGVIICVLGVKLMCVRG